MNLPREFAGEREKNRRIIFNWVLCALFLCVRGGDPVAIDASATIAWISRAARKADIGGLRRRFHSFDRNLIRNAYDVYSAPFHSKRAGSNGLVSQFAKAAAVSMKLVIQSACITTSI